MGKNPSSDHLLQVFRTDVIGAVAACPPAVREVVYRRVQQESEHDFLDRELLGALLRKTIRLALERATTAEHAHAVMREMPLN